MSLRTIFILGYTRRRIFPAAAFSYPPVWKDIDQAYNWQSPDGVDVFSVNKCLARASKFSPF